MVRGVTTVLKDCGGRVCEPAALLPGSLWSEAVDAFPPLLLGPAAIRREMSGSQCCLYYPPGLRWATLMNPPLPTTLAGDHGSWGCGPVPSPRVLRPLGLPIHAPWDVPVCRAQAASVLSRGTFVGLLVVEGGIQNGFSLP